MKNEALIKKMKRCQKAFKDAYKLERNICNSLGLEMASDQNLLMCLEISSMTPEEYFEISNKTVDK